MTSSSQPDNNHEGEASNQRLSGRFVGQDREIEEKEGGREREENGKRRYRKCYMERGLGGRQSEIITVEPQLNDMIIMEPDERLRPLTPRERETGDRVSLVSQGRSGTVEEVPMNVYDELSSQEMDYLTLKPHMEQQALLAEAYHKRNSSKSFFFNPFSVFSNFDQSSGAGPSQSSSLNHSIGPSAPSPTITSNIRRYDSNRSIDKTTKEVFTNHLQDHRVSPRGAGHSEISYDRSADLKATCPKEEVEGAEGKGAIPQETIKVTHSDSSPKGENDNVASPLPSLDNITEGATPLATSITSCNSPSKDEPIILSPHTSDLLPTRSTPSITITEHTLPTAPMIESEHFGEEQYDVSPLLYSSPFSSGQGIRDTSLRPTVSLNSVTKYGQGQERLRRYGTMPSLRSLANKEEALDPPILVDNQDDGLTAANGLPLASAPTGSVVTLDTSGLHHDASQSRSVHTPTISPSISSEPIPDKDTHAPSPDVQPIEETKFVKSGSGEGKAAQIQVVIYESERSGLFGGFSKYLLNSGAWCLKDGTECDSIYEYKLSPGWTWITEWTCKRDTAKYDHEGWQYSFSFWDTTWTNKVGTQTFVRRRKWVRVRRMDLNPQRDVIG
eukprot:Ihof_evm9s61 gene=Ihof_evmTU9s61